MNKLETLFSGNEEFVVATVEQITKAFACMSSICCPEDATRAFLSALEEIASEQ